MTRPHGMTVAQFNNIVTDMKKIYSFDDNEAHITSMLDIRSETISCLEISTVDSETGIHITMFKDLSKREFEGVDARGRDIT